MKNPPSVTDWIQAIAVTIGIGFALWEFVLHDRGEAREQAAGVRDLILARQSDAVAAAFEKMEIYRAVGYGTAREQREQAAAAYTVNNWFSAWGFCYSSQLCERKLTRDFICLDLLEWVRGIEKLVDDLTITKYRLLLQHCGCSEERWCQEILRENP